MKSGIRAALEGALQIARPGLAPAARDLGDRYLLDLERAPLGALGERLMLLELSRLGEERARCELDQISGAQARPTSPVLVVTGLPRTGTTLLHRLLARCEGVGTVSLATALRPSAPSPAVAEAETYARVLARASPALPEMHPMAPQEPEECTTHEQLTYASLRLAMIADTPGYRDALLHADASERRRRVAESVAILERAVGFDRPLVIKAPSHLLHLSELLDALPGSRVVWLHRSPLEVLPSFLALVRACRAVFSEAPDISREEAADWNRFWATAVARGSEDLPDERVLHLRFEALTAAPERTVGSVVTWWGAAVRRRTGEASVLPSAPNPHRSTLEDFGLSEREVDFAVPGMEAAGDGRDHRSMSPRMK